METETQTNAQAVESYLKLLLAFRSLPKSSRGRTFMEVSGYPHYENVASNILAFYFDPAAEHGLKDLLLSAFFQMAGVKEAPLLGKVKLYREWATDESKRIDLIVDGEAFTIGIENKIYHWLANDLEQYSQVIDRYGREKSIIIKAVLGLRDAGQLKGGFTSYTYAQLWQQVRALLGSYISNADPKWVSYLIDFMETTTNLAGENMQLQKTDHFFIEQHDVIEKMLAERNAFLTRLNQKVATLCEMMKETDAAKALCRLPWPHGSSCVVLDLSFADAYAISFDLYLSPLGWELQLFARNKKSSAYLAKLLAHPVVSARLTSAVLNNGRYVFQALPIHMDLGAIQDILCSWVDALVVTSKSVPNEM